MPGPAAGLPAARLHCCPPRIAPQTLLSVSQGKVTLFFLAVHAPHRGLEPHLVESWWQDTAALCRDIVKDRECVVAGDCNAAVGSITSDYIYDHASECEDLAGSHLHRLLQERGAWAPATFQQCHQGQSWTYAQKRNGRQIRPDLIAVPSSWWHGQVTSEVNVGIHAGQQAPDHFATTVAVTALLQPFLFHSEARSARCRRYDEEAIARPENREAVAAILSSLPDIGWSVPASEHASIIVEHLQTRLQAQFPLRNQHKGKRHSFLTDATWALHTNVARLRRACAACRARTDKHLVASAFLSWKAGRCALSFADLYFSPWKRQTQQAHAVYCRQLREETAQLRKACSQDRSQYLARCADQANAGLDSQAYAAVRRLLGQHRKKRFAPNVLPCLLKLDGAQCVSQEEVADDRWRQHFGSLEAGESALPSRILEACQDSRRGPWPAPPSLAAVPDEGSLARVIASRLFPLLLKLCFKGEEAAGLKGGTFAAPPAAGQGGRSSHLCCAPRQGLPTVAVPHRRILWCPLLGHIRGFLRSGAPARGPC